MTRRPPFRDGRLHIMSERCETCVFRAGNLMHLQPGRLGDLVRANLDADAALTCHVTTYGQAEQGEALCRGFVDAYGGEVLAVRMAQALEIVTEQEP